MTKADAVIGNLHLNAARQLMRRVSFADVLQAATEDDSAEAGWYEDTPEFWVKHLDRRGILDVTPDQVASDARKFRELEALVRALDSLETVASFSELTNEYVEFVERVPGIDTNRKSRESVKSREFWASIGEEVKNSKETMQPLLNNWLLVGIEGESRIVANRKCFVLMLKQRATRNCGISARPISPRRFWPISARCTLQAPACRETTCWSAWSLLPSLQSAARICRQASWMRAV